MKPRHAAALALVGWYLMVPPHPFGREVPLRAEWSLYHVYKSADMCEWSRRGIASGMLEDAPADFLQRFGNRFMDVFKQATCVAYDDPWFQGKME
jgi:hypothetical protein